MKEELKYGVKFMDISNKSTSHKKCSCYNAFQDERCGTGIRVHNRCKDGWRCTVCGKVRS